MLSKPCLQRNAELSVSDQPYTSQAIRLKLQTDALELLAPRNSPPPFLRQRSKENPRILLALKKQTCQAQPNSHRFRPIDAVTSRIHSEILRGYRMLPLCVRSLGSRSGPT